jgi:hypothetical protein
MALFGLSAFGEGLVKGLAEGATTSMQDEIKRIEDSIKTASDIRIKRLAQDQEKKREEAEKVVKALRRAKAQLGGVDDQQAAVRAASLLKQSGDLDAFNSLVDQISARTDLDYDKYFGDVSNMAPNASDLDIAYSFVEEGSIPMEPSTAAMGQIKPKGILSYVGPDIDAQRLVEQRTAEQMQLMDLGVRDVRKVAIPTIEFREEAFKLDGMTAEEEFNYVNDKIAKGDLTDEKATFYSDRAEQLAGRLGFDEQMQIATENLRVLQSASEPNAAEIAKAEQKVSNLGRQKRRVDTLKTGSTIELLKLDKEIALENKDYIAAAKINDQLVKSGAMTLDAYTSELNIRALSGDEAARTQLVKIGTYNAKLKQEIGDGTKRVTIPGVAAIRDEIRKEAVKILANDATLAAKGIQYKTDAYGNQILDLTSVETDAAAQAAYDNAFKTTIDQLYAKYEKNPDIMKDVNFVAALEAHRSGIDLDAKPKPPVPEVPSSLINHISGFDTVDALVQDVNRAAAERNKPINKEQIIRAAKAANKSDEFIAELQTKLGGAAPTPQPEPEPRPTPQPEADPAVTERNAAVDAIVDRFHNPIFSPTFIGQPSKVNRLIREELGLENTPENKQFVDQLMEESAARFARQLEIENQQQAEKVKQSAEGRPRLGIMSRDPSKVKQRMQ